MIFLSFLFKNALSTLFKNALSFGGVSHLKTPKCCKHTFAYFERMSKVCIRLRKKKKRTKKEKQKREEVKGRKEENKPPITRAVERTFLPGRGLHPGERPTHWTFLTLQHKGQGLLPTVTNRTTHAISWKPATQTPHFAWKEASPGQWLTLPPLVPQVLPRPVADALLAYLKHGWASPAATHHLGLSCLST